MCTSFSLFHIHLEKANGPKNVLCGWKLTFAWLPDCLLCSMKLFEGHYNYGLSTTLCHNVIQLICSQQYLMTLIMLNWIPKYLRAELFEFGCQSAARSHSWGTWLKYNLQPALSVRFSSTNAYIHICMCEALKYAKLSESIKLIDCLCIRNGSVCVLRISEPRAPTSIMQGGGSCWLCNNKIRAASVNCAAAQHGVYVMRNIC